MFCKNPYVNSTKLGLVALTLTFASVMAVTGPASSPVYASGGGHSGGGGGGSSGGGGGMSGGGSAGSSSGATSGGGSLPNVPTTACKKGTVFSKKRGGCVQASSGLLDDQELYQEGHDLALAGRYDEALSALDAVKTPDSMTFTMIGYATRKLGDYDSGLAYYQKALALDPGNVNTHEYLGEAYAEKGKLDLAKAELIKVASVCTDCEQYEDLEKAIEGKPAE